MSEISNIAQEEAKKNHIWYFVFGIKIAVIVALMLLIYYPVFIWMWYRWFATDSYYEHGFLVPIISAIIIWLKRRDLAKTLCEPSKLGLVLIIAGAILHIGSAFASIYFVSAYSFLVILVGTIIYFYGKKFARIIIFPLGFLFFMIPAPMAVIESTTLKMKMLTTQASVLILRILGMATVREGSTVYMSNTSAVVDDPCSGLKSLISLTALGILYAYIVKLSYPRKIMLFLISIPIALIANTIRTTAILMIANRYGNTIITNKYIHEGFGLMVFVIAFAGLFLTGRILECQMPQKNT